MIEECIFRALAWHVLRWGNTGGAIEMKMSVMLLFNEARKSSGEIMKAALDLQQNDLFEIQIYIYIIDID